MKIKLSDAGKRFSREWIFRHADLEFLPNRAYAITGANGSGKSTFLQTIASLLQPSEGSISYWHNNQPVGAENAYQYVSFCAPYLELVEEMMLTEFLYFHSRFKPFIAGFDPSTIAAAIGLPNTGSKQIRDFSSGMKQRVKLAQAIFSNTPVILLDEPCTNLDAAGIELYKSLIEQYAKGRLVIVSSNDFVEYAFCQEVINISQFK
ncbi:MAG: ATP-binding cassette domain-containing protein [Chitinophagaceae bacterium]